MKKLIIVLLAGMFVFSSCLGDLDQMPNTETTSNDVYAKAENYKAVLGKLYVAFVINGQEKGGGNSDLDSNNGYDYLRSYFNLQESGTDELAPTWLEGDKVTDITYLTWDANDPWVADMYYRIYYNIALCNEFLRNATDDKISGFTESEQDEIRTYRAEARFLRALAYYHAMDFYRNIPFITENDPVGAFVPDCYTSAQIFEYIENELTDIEESLPARSSTVYGHASQGAALALLAKLYLNAEVYTGKQYYTECIGTCKKIIAQGYSLESNYKKLFNADNDKRTNEIIFAFPVDATHAVSWGATTHIICGAVSNTSDYQKPADYGIASGWGMFRVRGEVPDMFDEEDGRALFFTEGQTQYLDAIDNQSYGYFVEKWTNLNDNGEAASNSDDGGVNTDFPVFRLADVYLMAGEAIARGGSGMSKSEVLIYLNELRERAFGDSYLTKGKLTEANLTIDFFLDERARELYWEGTRRTDLIRYDKFTTATYLWQWKGGVKNGIAVDSKYNYYPIPATELTANPNLSNPNY
ncbi:RagB/SusD family nutrient uptake outer membrane protein [Bacteroides sp. 519]|uniref:RagB/SusD family nutrient uptake outer membrane protein n=1 Tax=Bacteroides sp. 519 TaxID=2302937 RepID=UPI0013D11E44|nr:RagB/SusD family nutrient uptake outer membrane protein [Bacteroides sp. 519]NDV58252.1 RagB/SusD family nutrient uptake outer membrane protein [Bacteroides sp. 519]